MPTRWIGYRWMGTCWRSEDDTPFRSEPPQLRRDHRTPDGSYALSLSVRRQLREICQPGGSATGGWAHAGSVDRAAGGPAADGRQGLLVGPRTEEHTSELQSL